MRDAWWTRSRSRPETTCHAQAAKIPAGTTTARTRAAAIQRLRHHAARAACRSPVAPARSPGASRRTSLSGARGAGRGGGVSDSVGPLEAAGSSRARPCQGNRTAGVVLSQYTRASGSPGSVRDPVDDALAVVGDVELAVRADGDVDRPAPRPAVGEPAGREVLGARRRAREPDTDHLVARGRRAVPRPV